MFLNLRFCFCSEELVGLGVAQTRQAASSSPRSLVEKKSLLNDSFGEEQTDFFLGCE